MFGVKLACLIDFVICICYALLHISTTGELLGGELRNCLVSQVKHACLFDFVVCVCHAPLLDLMHCGLLASEFSEFDCIK